MSGTPGKVRLGRGPEKRRGVNREATGRDRQGRLLFPPVGLS